MIIKNYPLVIEQDIKNRDLQVNDQSKDDDDHKQVIVSSHDDNDYLQLVSIENNDIQTTEVKSTTCCEISFVSNKLLNNLVLEYF